MSEMSEPSSAAPAKPILELRAVRKSYGDEQVRTEVLHGVDLCIRQGEFAALIGPSGSGKSTLLNIIGLLDRPTSGTVLIDGRDTSTLDEDELTGLRAHALGFVFQFHHLIGAITAIENIMIPLTVARGRFTLEARERARVALAEVGLEQRTEAKPKQLSGGQQQRVAIARALVHRPALVLADEPTGNLDTSTADDIFKLLRRFNVERSLTFLIVTHDPRLAARCDRIITLVDGLIASDELNSASKPAAHSP